MCGLVVLNDVLSPPILVVWIIYPDTKSRSCNVSNRDTSALNHAFTCVISFAKLLREQQMVTRCNKSVLAVGIWSRCSMENEENGRFFSEEKYARSNESSDTHYSVALKQAYNHTYANLLRKVSVRWNEYSRKYSTCLCNCFRYVNPIIFYLFFSLKIYVSIRLNIVYIIIFYY